MDKASWLTNYPDSVLSNFKPNEYDSLVTFLEATFAKYNRLPMFENMGKSMTYHEIDLHSKAFAAFLQNYTSLQPGDHVAIQLPNLLQYPIAMFGLIRAGMVVVNINPLYTAHELSQQLKDAMAKGIIILANFAYNLSTIIQHTSIQHVIITEIGDLLKRPKGRFINFAIKHIKKLIPRYQFSTALQINSFNKVLKAGKKAKFTPYCPNADSVAFLQYTGGTTGVSKGAILTHGNMLANMAQIFSFMQLTLEEKKELVITPLPLYHIFSLTVNLFAMLQIGAKNILITNPRNIPKLVKLLRKKRFTCMTGVNTLFKALLHHPAFKQVDFSNLKITLSGGEALQDSIANQWESMTKVALIQGYGLTEAAPCVACNMPNGTHQQGTVGIPLPGTHIKIVDDSYQEVAIGQPGQLLVKGPQVMKKYWNNPSETEIVFWNGWIQTGDIALLQPNGFLKIIDRKKEMINISGFNVYPSEIESLVLSHPQVAEAAAIGVQEKEDREIVKLFVVKKDPSLTEAMLIAYCKKHLTNYKVPRLIVFREALPKSNVGKVLKYKLKQE